MRKHYLMLNTKPLLYCAIEKTGSTFWRRIFQVVGEGHKKRPSEILADNAYTENGYQSLKELPWDMVEETFTKTESIMFVRNPYQRLFSAWLDKLYSPNWIFWLVLGDEVEKTQRIVINKTSCAHDITFPEFIAHITNDVIYRKCVNSHFTPSFEHCWPCNFDINYIGKYETLKEDTMFLLKQLELKVEFQDFEQDAAKDAILDAVNWVQTQKKDILNCRISFKCALFKMWQRLKSRGIIGVEFELPYKTEDDALTVDYYHLYNDILEAHKKSDPTELRLNRERAFVLAIRSLSETLIKQVTDAYGIDFDMFEYDTDPLSMVTLETDSNNYDFFEQCV